MIDVYAGRIEDLANERKGQFSVDGPCIELPVGFFDGACLAAAEAGWPSCLL